LLCGLINLFLLWIRGAVDEGLIRCGEPLLSLDFLDDYELKCYE
jgi:hypothetical protein